MSTSTDVLELELLERARSKWRINYPEAHSTPWDSCNKLEFNGQDTCWLNPEHQKHLNAEHISREDLQDWIDGIPGKVIKSKEHWEELLYICRTNTTMIAYELEHFNMHPIEYLLEPGRHFTGRGKEEVGTGFPKRMQLPKKKDSFAPRKMSPEMIKAVEGHIKWLITEDLSRNFNGTEESIIKARVSRTTEEEIYGFTYALTCLGLQTNAGYSNTPMERENFAWWRNLLVQEARWQFLVSKGFGYQPWINNKRSFYSSNNED